MSARCAIVTDAAADLTSAYVEKAGGLQVLGFPYVIDGKSCLACVGDTMSGFYGAMRSGAVSVTSSISPGAYVDCFTEHVRNGDEVVYFGLAAALSGSFSSAGLAKEMVCAEQPDARVHLVDTRRASVAQGALVAEAVRMRDEGASAADIASWALGARDATIGHFTLDTLEHLRRGGRISDVAAAAGSMLDIRPMLTFTAVGELTLNGVVRGRKRSIKALADNASGAPQDALLFVGYADCEDDVCLLEEMIASKRADLRMERCEIGPVIGTHVGPGMLAVAYTESGK
ncbi:MAG: DegV family protein [Coriobacteriia bacterium]|nr:DegV family protein [Coriobacteriia bacterium]